MVVALQPAFGKNDDAGALAGNRAFGDYQRPVQIAGDHRVLFGRRIDDFDSGLNAADRIGFYRHGQAVARRSADSSSSVWNS